MWFRSIIGNSTFPSRVVPGSQHRPVRLAWDPHTPLLLLSWNKPKTKSAVQRFEGTYQRVVSPHPIRVAAIEGAGSHKSWRGRGEIGTLLDCRWTWEMVPSLWKRGWRLLNTLSFGNATSGYKSKEFEAGSQRIICASTFVSAWVPVTKRWRQRKHLCIDYRDRQNVIQRGCRPSWKLEKAGNPSAGYNTGGALRTSQCERYGKTHAARFHLQTVSKAPSRAPRDRE